MKKLPIGIQTFSKIREEDYLYVDKTEHIHRLITSGSYYFLSRPRRFGKSLTLSTIREIYEGNKALFEGLWIENHRDWSQVRPVVHIQFNEIGYNTGGLEVALHKTLDAQAALHGLALTERTYDQKFRELIRELAALKGKVVLLIDEYDKPLFFKTKRNCYGQKVVLLIDEYDKPLIDYLEKDQLPTAFEHQRILKNFYSIIKSADPYLEFLLITGVSKFSKVSVFSDLNNLNDITLNPRHATLVGYTQAELEAYFQEWIQNTLQEMPGATATSLLVQIKEWYNGYTWNGRDYVYNPFSVLNFFANGTFQGYWFKTGTPSFLIHKIKEAGYFNLNDIKANEQLFESYTLDNLDIRSLLFQTGYLTIKKIDWELGLFELNYPNREVEQAMTSHLIGALLSHPASESVSPVLQIEEAFMRNNPARVVEIINALLKDVPSHLLDDKGEHFYHALVHLHFRYLGLFMQSEVHTSDGRMDAVVQTPTHVYLLEFKIDQSAEVALAQIRKKGYADKFRTENKPVVGVGINFNTTKRAVGDWVAEAV